MHLEIRNVGPIEELDLPIRPLTVLIGKNNSGKTTIAHCLYAAARRSLAHAAEPMASKHLTLGGLFAETIRTTDALKAESLPNFFQDRSGVYGAGSARLRYTEDEVRAAVCSQLGVPAETSLDAEIPPRARPGSPGPAPRNWNSGRFYDFLRGVATSLPPGVPFALPAERAALVLTYKMLANRRFRMLRERSRRAFVHTAVDPGEEEALARGLGEPRFAEPIETFLDFLADAEQAGLGRGSRQYARTTALREVHERLARAILGGQSLEWESVGIAGGELRLRLDGNRAIDLHLASSALKNVAPLLLWLQQPRGRLLVIDEPELGLHPIAQAKVLEALALVAQKGVRVFLTTHSSTIMAHLNNLIVRDPGDARLRAAQGDALYLKTTEAFMDPDHVAAFEVVGGKIRNLYEEDWGIRWDSLSEGSAEIDALYFKLLKLGEGRSDAGE